MFIFILKTNSIKFKYNSDWFYLLPISISYFLIIKSPPVESRMFQSGQESFKAVALLALFFFVSVKKSYFPCLKAKLKTLSYIIARFFAF